MLMFSGDIETEHQPEMGYKTLVKRLYSERGKKFGIIILSSNVFGKLS